MDPVMVTIRNDPYAQAWSIQPDRKYELYVDRSGISLMRPEQKVTIARGLLRRYGMRQPDAKSGQGAYFFLEIGRNCPFGPGELRLSHHDVPLLDRYIKSRISSAGQKAAKRSGGQDNQSPVERKSFFARIFRRKSSSKKKANPENIEVDDESNYSVPEDEYDELSEKHPYDNDFAHQPAANALIEERNSAANEVKSVAIEEYDADEVFYDNDANLAPSMYENDTAMKKWHKQKNVSTEYEVEDEIRVSQRDHQDGRHVVVNGNDVYALSTN